MQVHIDRNGSRYGPYNIEDINAYLANGTLLPTDLAWHEGLNGWVPLANIQGAGNGTSAMMPQAVGVASQEQQNNQWGMFIHLSCALPGIGWITSIVLWKIKVQELPGTDVHGKNSANWIISIIIYWAVFHGVIQLITTLEVAMISELLTPLQMALGAIGIILPVIAGIKANNGEVWKNPLAITFLT